MVQVTVELVRKKAEHHEKQLAPLEEIALHQESIEKIEFIQDWCPKLRILLLQSNLISKIENLNKLKNLEYLNLAINNIEKVENLERCESLKKLDLTLNFIGDLTSIQNLKNNYNLQTLYLNGNPCTDYPTWREYVIAVLPQLEYLDNADIKRSERISALQNIFDTESEILKYQKAYKIKRADQKVRLEKEIDEKWRKFDENENEEERIKRFWNEKSEHSPEVRMEMDRQTQLKKTKEKSIDTQEKKKKDRPLFAPDGRPFNINQQRIPFRFNDEHPEQFTLDLATYKYLDTSLIDIDVQPLYVRVTIKGKIFQICLPEEINVSNSTAQRSQVTGHLIIKMPKLKISVSWKNKTMESPESGKYNTTTKNECSDSQYIENNRREYLEIGSSKEVLDFTKIITKQKEVGQLENKYKFKSHLTVFPKEKLPSTEFIDDPDVPPLS